MESKILQKGVVLYLALIITSILLAIGLGLTVIIISQLRMVRNIGDSVVALYVADTGIEHSLYDKRVSGSETGGVVSGNLGPDLDYHVDYISGGPAGQVWKSVGTFKGSKRSIEIGIMSLMLPEEKGYSQFCIGACDTKANGDCMDLNPPERKCPDHPLDWPCTENCSFPVNDPPNPCNCDHKPVPPNMCPPPEEELPCPKMSCWAAGTCYYECPSGYKWDAPNLKCIPY